MQGVSNVRLLLIQDGEVKGCCGSPAALLSCKDYDRDAPFKVAIGCVNEFGEREIVGIVAVVGDLNDRATWYVSSKQDGYKRHVGSTGYPEVLITNRLTVMWNDGDFNDLANLPSPVTIMPG